MNPPGRLPGPEDDAFSESLVTPRPDRPGLRRLGWVLWPAFMAAAALEVAVFALVDPGALHTPGGEALGLSTTAVYSLSFLAFWAATAAAAAAALWLSAGQGQAPPRWAER